MRGVNLLPAPRVEKRQDAVQSGLRSKNGIAAAAGAALVAVAALLAARVRAGTLRCERPARDARPARGTGRAEAGGRLRLGGSLRAGAGAPRRLHGRVVRTFQLGRPARPARARDAAGRLARHHAADAGCDECPATAGNATSAAVTTNGLSSSGGALPRREQRARSPGTRSRGRGPHVLDRLALIPALSEVSLQSMQRADVAGKKAMHFTIVANVRTAGGNG